MCLFIIFSCEGAGERVVTRSIRLSVERARACGAGASRPLAGGSLVMSGAPTKCRSLSVYCCKVRLREGIKKAGLVPARAGVLQHDLMSVQFSSFAVFGKRFSSY